MHRHRRRGLSRQPPDGAARPPRRGQEPSFGPGEADGALASMLAVYAYAASEPGGSITLHHLRVGSKYQLQIIANECCSANSFQIDIDGQRVYDQFRPDVLHGGVAAVPTVGAIIAKVTGKVGVAFLLERDLVDQTGRRTRHVHEHQDVVALGPLWRERLVLNASQIHTGLESLALG